ncbi:MAG: outer membrane protein assembly factor BamE [Candidatus Aminicenantes bacterium]|nr:outer membrane protein assembly factor BamE [Candidatus Aminicenantes bacterium]
MKKVSFPLIVIFLLGFSFVLSGNIPRDIYGQGNARWGDSKAHTKKRFANRRRTNVAKVSQSTNTVVIDYVGERINRKKYEFSKNRLVKIHVYYNNPSRRVLKTHTQKYGNPTLAGGYYTWNFPSTIIKHKRGSQKVLFRDSSYVSGKASKQQNIDRVTLKMTTSQVRALMGTPVSTATAAGGISYYRYSTGTITFKFGRVIKVTRGTGSVARKGANQGNIDSIRIGMTTAQVEAIMGKPVTVNALGNLLVYNYSTGKIAFKFRKVANVQKIN